MTHDAYISLQSVDPDHWDYSIGEREEWEGLKLDIYQHLLSINAGYEQVTFTFLAPFDFFTVQVTFALRPGAP